MPACLWAMAGHGLWSTLTNVLRTKERETACLSITFTTTFNLPKPETKRKILQDQDQDRAAQNVHFCRACGRPLCHGLLALISTAQGILPRSNPRRATTHAKSLGLTPGPVVSSLPLPLPPSRLACCIRRSASCLLHGCCFCTCTTCLACPGPDLPPAICHLPPADLTIHSHRHPPAGAFCSAPVRSCLLLAGSCQVVS